jgi:hypothetical protein
MSRFDPTVAELKVSLAWTQERTERLAVRIVSAREVLRNGRSSGIALAILDGSEEATVTGPRPPLTLETPLTDGLLDFGDWEATS